MKLYFTNTHPLGMECKMIFQYGQRRYGSLLDFAERNPFEFSVMKQAALAKIECNPQLSVYFHDVDTQFYCVSQEAFWNLKCRKDYEIIPSDLCGENILGKIYDSILEDCAVMSRKQFGRVAGSAPKFVFSSRRICDLTRYYAGTPKCPIRY